MNIHVGIEDTEIVIHVFGNLIEIRNTNKQQFATIATFADMICQILISYCSTTLVRFSVFEIRCDSMDFHHSFTLTQKTWFSFFFSSQRLLFPVSDLSADVTSTQSTTDNVIELAAVIQIASHANYTCCNCLWAMTMHIISTVLYLDRNFDWFSPFDCDTSNRRLRSPISCINTYTFGLLFISINNLRSSESRCINCIVANQQKEGGGVACLVRVYLIFDTSECVNVSVIFLIISFPN